MSWASGRCKSQCASMPCRATLRRLAPCPASLHLLQNRAKLRSASLRLLSPRRTTHRSTIVSGSRLKPAHHQQPFVVKLVNFNSMRFDALRFFAGPRYVSLCGAVSCNAIVLGSRLKPCSTPAALRGETGDSIATRPWSVLCIAIRRRPLPSFQVHD